MKMVVDHAVSNGVYEFVDRVGQIMRSVNEASWVDYLLLDDVQGEPLLGRWIRDFTVGPRGFLTLVGVNTVEGKKRLKDWAEKNGKVFIHPGMPDTSRLKLEILLGLNLETIPKPFSEYHYYEYWNLSWVW
jgi:hypothetical protein